MLRAARLALATAVLVAVVVALRAVVLRRNEARYGGPHTPYGPDGESSHRRSVP